MKCPYKLVEVNGVWEIQYVRIMGGVERWRMVSSGSDKAVMERAFEVLMRVWRRQQEEEMG